MARNNQGRGVTAIGTRGRPQTPGRVQSGVQRPLAQPVQPIQPIQGLSGGVAQPQQVTPPSPGTAPKDTSAVTSRVNAASRTTSTPNAPGTGYGAINSGALFPGGPTGGEAGRLGVGLLAAGQGAWPLAVENILGAVDSYFNRGATQAAIENSGVASVASYVPTGTREQRFNNYSQSINRYVGQTYGPNFGSSLQQVQRLLQDPNAFQNPNLVQSVEQIIARGSGASGTPIVAGQPNFNKPKKNLFGQTIGYEPYTAQEAQAAQRPNIDAETAMRLSAFVQADGTIDFAAAANAGVDLTQFESVTGVVNPLNEPPSAEDLRNADVATETAAYESDLQLAEDATALSDQTQEHMGGIAEQAQGFAAQAAADRETIKQELWGQLDATGDLPAAVRGEFDQRISQVQAAMDSQIQSFMQTVQNGLGQLDAAKMEAFGLATREYTQQVRDSVAGLDLQQEQAEFKIMNDRTLSGGERNRLGMLARSAFANTRSTAVKQVYETHNKMLTELSTAFGNQLTTFLSQATATEGQLRAQAQSEVGGTIRSAAEAEAHAIEFSAALAKDIGNLMIMADSEYGALELAGLELAKNAYSTGDALAASLLPLTAEPWIDWYGIESRDSSFRLGLAAEEQNFNWNMLNLELGNQTASQNTLTGATESAWALHQKRQEERAAKHAASSAARGQTIGAIASVASVVAAPFTAGLSLLATPAVAAATPPAGVTNAAQGVVAEVGQLR